MHFLSSSSKQIAYSSLGFLLFFVACSSSEPVIDSGTPGDAKTSDGPSADAAPIAPHEPYPHSFVVLNDPPGVSWITRPEETLSVSGVAGFVSELSYQLEREQGDADAGSLELGHHWQLEGLTLTPGDNRLTITGKGIADGEEHQDLLTVTHNPGLTMGPVTATPSELNHEGGEPVLVTVEFMGSPTFGADGIQLFTADDQGTISGAALATLNDAAQDGDLTAGDGIYSSRVTLDTSQATTHFLRLKMAFEPSGSTAYSARSELFQVVVFPPFTSADAQALETTVELVKTNYASYSQTGDKAAAFAKVADDLMLIPEIADAEADEEGYSVWWEMKSGINFVYTDFPEGTKGGAGDEDSAGMFKAILLEPFAAEFGAYAEAVAVKKILDDFLCPPVAPIYMVTDKAVTVDEFKKIHQYNIVFIDSHGWISSRRFSKGQVYIALEQKADWPTIKDKTTQLNKDVRAGRLYLNGDTISDLTFGITGRFVRHYNKSFPPGAIVHVGSCGSMMNLSMAQAFLKNGVYAYTGWNREVSYGYALDMMRTYYRALKEGKSVPQAVMEARSHHGQVDPAYPKTRFLSVLSGSDHRANIECSGFTRLTETLEGSINGAVVFYSVDKLQPVLSTLERYDMKEARKTCSFSKDYGDKQITGKGTLVEVYPDDFEWDPDRRSTITKIEIDRAANTLKIAPMPYNADYDKDDNWVSCSNKTWNASWTSASGCHQFAPGPVPQSALFKTFTGDEVEIGKDYIRGKVPYTNDKGHGTFEFYYDLTPD